ncbi:DUF4410 domain-containing protein [Litorilituus sediminis]|uniref:DUF4410 domain-containing protein n=1 Tax=Litorilituus sediminis TaxID=718192 RepID=A0A4P6P999_9GAMM|nr:DUF4410 domain-containing protein [Litorilituus sediminis]QBG36869.1 DUF4410 domain-containing protein [Litorilituus sediminis]
MKYGNAVFLLLISLVISGCAAPRMFITQPYMPTSADSFEYKISQKVKVKENALAIFSEQIGKSLAESKLNENVANKLLDITFTSYNVRHGAKRAMLGVFAGSDYVVTQVVIYDKSSGEAVSKFRVISENNKAVGSTKGLLQDHAKKTIAYIKTGRA